MDTTAMKIRNDMREMMRIHEELGDAYLALCEGSEVKPLPVLWQTFPPCPEGETQAYVMFGYDGETDRHGQAGFDVYAPTRAELAQEVFVRVMMIRSVN
jgi:hypothetical protein